MNQPSALRTQHRRKAMAAMRARRARLRALDQMQRMALEFEAQKLRIAYKTRGGVQRWDPA